MAKNKEIKIPQKRSMNLAQEEKKKGSSTGTTRILLIILLVLVIGAGIVWRYVKLGLDYRTLKNTEAELAATEEQLTDYDEIKAEYDKYAKDFMTDTEAAYEDRMGFIRVANSAVNGLGEIRNISIVGNEAAVKVAVDDLDKVASIRSRLENVEKVNDVRVYTADTDSSKEDAKVIASLVFDMGKQLDED